MTPKVPDSLRPPRRWHALTLALPLTLLMALPAAAQAPTPDEAAALAAGEPAVNVAMDSAIDAARVRAAIDIPAPPATVWSVMTDCAHMMRFVPGLESCRVVEADPQGRWDVREHKINWAWFLPNIRTVFRADYDKPKTIKFRRIGGDLKMSEGQWRLVPRDGGTRLLYDALVAADVPVPNFVVLEAIRTDMAKVLRQLRAECAAVSRAQ
ncbi:MAG: SRPBCC family protein [Xanthobacteraceae bacterium]|jgi:uncharacterized protein YndB with AHSA1/START domain|uniref:SRPBCC family protein n=1 Tax=Pseudolabrys sp. TaxID=1960880 RepID=UPI003D11AD19